jgi:hypothetical protein
LACAFLFLGGQHWLANGHGNPLYAVLLAQAVGKLKNVSCQQCRCNRAQGRLLYIYWALPTRIKKLYLYKNKKQREP